jgi:tetrahydromethanopterin S-methyltransferase subunit G
MESKIQTIEDLARLMQNTMASKEDLQGLATKEDLQELRGEMNERLDHLDARVGRIEADVHALRDEMVHRREFEDVLDRVKYIEKKLGIESGV